MLSIEAMLTVPLSIVIFIEGILFIKPVQIRLEHKTKIVAKQRVSPIKNQHLFQVQQDGEITGLETSPQKVQELISLSHDMQQMFESDRGN